MCPECELGLLLTADEAWRRSAREAFLVVDAGLTSARSRKAAEKLFAIAETDVVDQPLENVLVAAESSDDARGGSTALLSGAAREPLSARRARRRDRASGAGVRRPLPRPASAAASPAAPRSSCSRRSEAASSRGGGWGSGRAASGRMPSSTMAR